MADRSTAAVGVANEGGATSDGTATDDLTSTSSDGDVTEDPSREQPDPTAEPAADTASEPGPAARTARPPEAATGAAPDAATEPLPVDAGSATEPLALGLDATEPLPAATAEPAEPAEPAGRDDAVADAAGEPSAGPDEAEPAAQPASEDAPEPTSAAAAPATAPDSEATTVGTTVAGEDAQTIALAEAGRAASSATATDAATATDTDTTAVTHTGTDTGTPVGTAGSRRRPKAPATAPELHSGHKLARRYQLEECVTRVDGFSSWRAVDEKLRRAVGIHLLPADHPRARPVLSAARSAALLGDPRFVQVLDALEEDDLVYVIHEWLPDATSLADLLAAGPLEPHEAYQMVSQVSQGMAAAHREGLAHLRLDPGDVLRTMSGQYRIRGLAVAAALRGLSSDRPQRKDTESIGALLYASLTQRWPYEEDAHGLSGLPKGVGLVAPDQVRAGVHRGLSEVAMRALVNDGATASREDPPCTTPEELAKAVAAVPRIRPPEHPAPVYQQAAFVQPAFPQAAPPHTGGGRTAVAPPAPPPALPGRTGQALKYAVAALVIVAIALGSWQLADALQSRGNQPTKGSTPTGQQGGNDPTHAAPATLRILSAKDFDPLGQDLSENPQNVPNAYDNNPATYWDTSWYNSADLGGLKPGVGLVIDLGGQKSVSKVTVNFIGVTDVQLLAAHDVSTMPTGLSGFTEVATGTGTNVTLTPRSKLSARYLLVWLTKLPPTPDGKFRGKISEIHVMG